VYTYTNQQSFGYALAQPQCQPYSYAFGNPLL
jgi:hypothetical protein